MTKKGFWAGCVLLLLTPGLALGAGFHIREQGTKAMGMANAFVAQADDPSAIFYNPAGIVQLDGTRLSLGVTAINVPGTEFEGTTYLGDNRDKGLPGALQQVDTKARDDIFFPPNAYLTHHSADSPWAFGIGVNLQFPLAKRWDGTTAFRDEVKELSIKPININPTVAYEFEKWHLALGVGIDYTFADVWLEKDSCAMVPDGQGSFMPRRLASSEIEGKGDGWGYNAGLLWQPLPQLSLGISYRSEIDLDIDEGDADFLLTPTGLAVLQGTNGYSGAAAVSTDASTEITLPETWSFGIAYKPVDGLVVEVDADYFGWSSYDELDIQLTGSPLGNSPGQPKDWDDVWAYRLGIAYRFLPAWEARAGYCYDNTPVPEATLGPELPGADREDYALGLGYYTDRAVLDVAYMYVDFEDRQVANDIARGTYKSEAHLVAGNLTYFF